MVLRPENVRKMSKFRINKTKSLSIYPEIACIRHAETFLLQHLPEASGLEATKESAFQPTGTVSENNAHIVVRPVYEVWETARVSSCIGIKSH